MANIRELLGLGGLNDEAFASCLALGILYGRAVERNKSSPLSINSCGERIRAMIMGAVGKELPGSATGFSKEQAEKLLEFFNSGSMAMAILEWTVDL